VDGVLATGTELRHTRFGAQVSIPVLLLSICLAAQLYLVLFKSFNWDEFLHYNQLLKLRAGTFDEPFQSVHLRLLWWAPDVAANLIDQMRAARIFVWGVHLVTLIMIYGVARQFTNAANAFFAAFAYMGAGYVFTQAFSIRHDPFVTAVLMSSLFLMAKAQLTLFKSICVGVLIGLAGIMSFKAMFYAPCFAGLAWLRLRETPSKPQLLAKLVVISVAGALSFAVIYLWHTSGFPHTVAATPLAHTGQRPSFIPLMLRWITIDLPFVRFVLVEIALAPLFFLCAVLAPLAWTRVGLRGDAKLALAGFLAPLASLVFYRNTFPYYFEFVLAPPAVAIAPALGIVRERYGNAFLSLVLSAVPLAMTVLEPRDMIKRQRALIDYVHREFPKKTGYLDYSSMIADYPRILTVLTSGNGIRYYYEARDPIVGREIDRGKVAFVIANQEVIQAALSGHPFPGTFLPDDMAAISGNYVQQWGVLWREGVLIPAGSGAFRFELRRDGDFVLAGAPLTIDGATVAAGSIIALSRGPHLVSGERNSPVTLWRGNRLPTTPPNIPMDRVFTNF